MAVEELLAARGLRIYYHTMTGVVKAVDGVDLKIHRGETVGLLGESGCGKSTLGLSILRLLPSPPAKITGEVLLEGVNLATLSPDEMRKVRGRQVTMIFQDPATYLNPVLKIKDQMAEMLGPQISGKDTNVEIGRSLDMVGLRRSVMASYPHQLSGGMKQRVLIAMAIMSNPLLMIADEPTTALDVTIQAQILNLLEEIIRKTGISVLLVTHDWVVVSKIAQKVYVMYAGKMVEHGETRSVYERPLHPYTNGLMNCVLDVNRKIARVPSIEGYPPNLANPPSGCRFHPRCKMAIDKCRTEEPPWIEAENGRFVACWRVT